MKHTSVMTPKIVYGLSLLLLVCSLGSGCSKSDTTICLTSDPADVADTLPSEETTLPSPEEYSYVFYCQGQNQSKKESTITLYPGMLMAGILEQLPDPLSVYEAPSCALEGMDIIYTYSGYELTIYSAGDGTPDILTSIRLTDDSHTTAEDIYIGSTATELTTIYGDAAPVSGEYRYQKGEMELSLLTRNQTVISIEYRLMEDAYDN